METIKVKKCKCGNVITAKACVTGHNSSLTRIEGEIINRDADDRVLCICNKVHHFGKVFENWINKNQPNRLER